MISLRASIAGLALAGAMMAGAPTPAAASILSTFTFTGVCDDCATVGPPPLPEDNLGPEPLFLGHGTLVLRDYTTGAVARDQFVSFEYHSNLVAFSVSPTDLGSFIADLSNVPGEANVLIAKDLFGPIANADGSTTFGFLGGLIFDSRDGEGASWSVSFAPGGGGDGPSINDDIGSHFNWSLTSQNTVPEPGTWMLLIGGLSLAGAQLRAARKRRLA